MAPAAVEVPFANRDGLALESTSDSIDAVNLIKANLKKEAEKSMYEKSQFDAEKDKTQFRQYEDACDRVKNFYLEQHTKQTVAFNLKARKFDFQISRIELDGEEWY